MKKNRTQITASKRAEVMEKTGGACYYCGAFATDVDHFVPWSYVANDTINNLIPSCKICNQIAYNRHFLTLAEKKKYILQQRDSSKWRRRIARMEVIMIHVDQYGKPTGIVSANNSGKVNRPPVWEAPYHPPKISKPKKDKPRKVREPISKRKYHKPIFRKMAKDHLYKEIALRGYLRTCVEHDVSWDALRIFVFMQSHVQTLRDFYNRKRPFTHRQVSRLYNQFLDRSKRAQWAIGIAPERVNPKIIAMEY